MTDVRILPVDPTTPTISQGSSDGSQMGSIVEYYYPRMSKDPLDLAYGIIEETFDTDEYIAEIRGRGQGG